METMDKQKTKGGIIEMMPKGKIQVYFKVTEFTDAKELEIIEDYIDMGYLPEKTTYSIVGGNVSSIDFKYLDEDGFPQEGEMPYVNHGVLLMKTILEKYVPTKNK